MSWNPWEQDSKLTVDVQVVLREDLGTIVNRVPGAVEYPAQHVLCDGELHRAAGELDVRRLDVDARRALEDLHDRLLTLHLEHLTTTLGAIRQRQRDDLVVRRKLRAYVSSDRLGSNCRSCSP
jgi:hypothetical protein